MKSVNIGKGHSVMAGIIITIISYGSRATKALKTEFDTKHKTINLTGGEPTKTLILCKEGWLLLSSVSSDTITKRIEKLSSNLVQEPNV